MIPDDIGKIIGIVIPIFFIALFVIFLLVIRKFPMNKVAWVVIVVCVGAGFIFMSYLAGYHAMSVYFSGYYLGGGADLGANGRAIEYLTSKTGRVSLGRTLLGVIFVLVIYAVSGLVRNRTNPRKT